MSRSHSTSASLFRFCPFCGTPLAQRTEEGKSHPRATCWSCGYVQYRNPVVGVAAVILESDIPRESAGDAQAFDTHPRVLLGRRVPAVSRGGLWCLPCGYVEYDEDVREALTREVCEETGLVVEAQELVAVHSNFHEPDRQTVGIWFRVRVTGGALLPGDDVDDLRFVPPGDPGVPLAFPTDAFVLTEISGIRYHS